MYAITTVTCLFVYFNFELFSDRKSYWKKLFNAFVDARILNTDWHITCIGLRLNFCTFAVAGVHHEIYVATDTCRRLRLIISFDIWRVNIPIDAYIYIYISYEYWLSLQINSEALLWIQFCMSVLCYCCGKKHKMVTSSSIRSFHEMSYPSTWISEHTRDNSRYECVVYSFCIVDRVKIYKIAHFWFKKLVRHTINQNKMNFIQHTLTKRIQSRWLT